MVIHYYILFRSVIFLLTIIMCIQNSICNFITVPGLACHNSVHGPGFGLSNSAHFSTLIPFKICYSIIKMLDKYYYCIAYEGCVALAF